MINTHGMKMHGLRRVSGETKKLSGYYNATYLQLNYDTETGYLWTDYHNSLGHNWWTDYHDADVVVCGNICEPMTMQEIADMVRDRVRHHQYLRAV